MNINNETVGVARSKIFLSLVMKEGKILRGTLESRMGISSGTFGKEYLSWLEQYPNIHYNKKDREFTYSP